MLVEIAPLGPVSCGSTGFSFRGRTTLTLVVKVTFALVHQGVAELIDPEPIHVAEVHHRGNPMRSIRASSDLAPYLRRADVMFVGHACAPGGVPAPVVRARLMVLRDGAALVDKILVVEGDPNVEGGGEPKPFERMPILYERSFGGAGWPDNPLGVGAVEGSARPNVFDARDRSRSAGFSPISRAWPARKRLLAGVDRKKLDLPIAELPDAFDWSYFQSAPPDQQTEFLRGDERLLLEGVHPTLPRFETRLPSTRAAARVFGLPGAPGGRPLGFQLDTLLVDGDAMTCAAVFRATIPAPEVVGALRVVAGLEVPGMPHQVLAFDAEGRFTAMPWPQSPEDLAPPPATAPSLGDSGGYGSSAATMALDGDAPAYAAPAAPESFDRTRSLSDEESVVAAQKPAAPFLAPASVVMPSAFATPSSRAPSTEPSAALSPGSGPRAVVPQSLLVATPALPLLGDDATALEGPTLVSAGLVAPPSFRLPANQLAERRPSVEAPAPKPADSRPGPLSSDEKRPSDAVDLAECASIAAELALARSPRAAVLRAHLLDEPAWRAAEKRHNDAIEVDQLGQLRTGFDAAFVEAIERLRGAISPDHYAELLYATERGELAGALAEVGLTKSAWQRVQRVLKRRSANDPSYAASTDRALEALRA